jgi:solute:Na+ symporter, SSS family
MTGSDVSYFYQYAVGGAVFLIGMIYAWRQRYIGFAGKRGLMLAVLVGGLAGFMLLQGYLQFAPMGQREPVPYDGSYVHKERLGTPLDYGVMVGYFLLILAVGTYFAKNQKTTRDFFFGGQRFSWWLISFSLVATTVGSYSFVKYSEAAFEYGLSSSMSYLNDWFWMPLLVFGWLPLLYFSRVTSVPEYFERRFGPTVRAASTLLILLYLIGYVGVNLFTMGTALQAMLGWELQYWAILVACVSAIYVTAGGQTSVIMTDLFQGLMLLLTGIIILLLGVNYFGGFDALWEHIPRPMREAFANFNEKPAFNSVGIFWQDAMANTAMFYFLNQGIIMRFMAAKSVNEARKAALVTPAVLMVLAAIATASGGWVARAMVHGGHLPPELEAKNAFYVTTELLSRPGVFGLIVSTLIAALMSTVDTLVTAISAITVNDVYKPYIRQRASDAELLKVARVVAVLVMVVGVLSVPIFQQYASVYQAHGAFTAAVTPPLVVTLLLAVFWRRFTRVAALCTLIGGLGLVMMSGFFPQMIDPFAHGVPRSESSGFFEGMRQHTYMRAFFGLVVSGIIGVVVTFVTSPEPWSRMRGLVWGTIADALEHYKGAPGRESGLRRAVAMPRAISTEQTQGSAHLPLVNLTPALAQSLQASRGDLLYIRDRRWWLGGLRSVHAIVGEVIPSADNEAIVDLGPRAYALTVGPHRAQEPLVVERLY